jgi:hypothetical protein
MFHHCVLPLTLSQKGDVTLWDFGQYQKSDKNVKRLFFSSLFSCVHNCTLGALTMVGFVCSLAYAYGPFSSRRRPPVRLLMKKSYICG